MFSLIVIGTPSSGERGAPERQRASAARACSSAASRSSRYIAFSFGSHASMRARLARVASTGESLPLAYAADSASAESGITSALYTLLADANAAFHCVAARRRARGRARRSAPLARGGRLARRRAGDAGGALQRFATRRARRHRLQRRSASRGARGARTQRDAARPSL